MNTKKYQLYLIILSVLLCFTSCQKKEEPDITHCYSCDAGPWILDTAQYTFGHDCEPFHSEHFSIYSDCSSPASKENLALLAEDFFSELIIDFQIQNIENELLFSHNYSYYIYAIKNKDLHSELSPGGCRNGFLVAAYDHEYGYSYNIPAYLHTLKHEMIHTFQFTLTDLPAGHQNWLSTWFSEGQAEFMSNSIRPQIDTVAKFDDWYAAHASHQNPISIHRFIDYPDRSRFPDYYPMFTLAYAYLLDQRYGLGFSMADIRKLFQLIKEGSNFSEAFENVFGFSVSHYRDNFDTWLREYLGKLES